MHVNWDYKDNLEQQPNAKLAITFRFAGVVIHTYQILSRKLVKNVK